MVPHTSYFSLFLFPSRNPCGRTFSSRLLPSCGSFSNSPSEHLRVGPSLSPGQRGRRSTRPMGPESRQCRHRSTLRLRHGCSGSSDDLFLNTHFHLTTQEKHNLLRRNKGLFRPRDKRSFRIVGVPKNRVSVKEEVYIYISSTVLLSVERKEYIITC